MFCLRANWVNWRLWNRSVERLRGSARLWTLPRRFPIKCYLLVYQEPERGFCIDIGFPFQVSLVESLNRILGKYADWLRLMPYPTTMPIPLLRPIKLHFPICIKAPLPYPPLFAEFHSLAIKTFLVRTKMKYMYFQSYKAKQFYNIYI